MTQPKLEVYFCEQVQSRWIIKTSLLNGSNAAAYGGSLTNDKMVSHNDAKFIGVGLTL